MPSVSASACNRIEYDKELVLARRPLAGRQREVVELRYGTSAKPPMTLLEAGFALGVSRERIRQIEGEALERLRRRLARTPLALP